MYDGIFGEDDTEQPMIHLGFHTTDTHAREERKTVTSTSTAVSGGVRTTTTTTTRTTNKSSTSGGDPFSVKVLTTDLTNGLNQLKEDLNAEQSDIFRYEDGRTDTLGHLENVQRELENEHINDQVFGAHLNRLDKQVSSEIGIATSGHNDDQESLKRRITHTNGIIKEREPVVSSEQKNNKGLENTLSQTQGQQKTPASSELLKDNDGQRKNIQTNLNTVKKERDAKTKIFNQHADLVNKYNDLATKYEKSLIDTEVKRVEIERDSNKTNSELRSQTAEGTNLEHFLETTSKSSTNHQSQAKALKADHTNLTKHYSSFLDHLNKLVSSQGGEIERLNNHLRDQQKETDELTSALSESTSKIVSLHSEVDKDNAANLNAKLSTLISTLVEVDKARRESQDKLENSQENWTAKLKLFQDEAARSSRETANNKRSVEVDNLLAKLDRLNRDQNEIAKQRDVLEARVISDSNRDVVNDNLQKELDGINLKLRWADDEVKKTEADLQDLLNFIEFKKSFIADQEAQIQSLRTEITEIRTLIEERITTISELEEEIRQCDIEIARLRAEIAELDRRIQELQDAIAEKDAEINELNKILAARNARLKQLESELKGSQYVAVKGDMIDELLAKYIQNCPVPVKRLGGGFYLFGLRKIYAKIMNGKLVIRVGGGYMIIEKFIETYADQELQKLIRVAEREGVSNFMELDLEAIALGPKSPTGRSPTGKSPTGKASFDKSAKGSFNKSSKMSSINGTNRSPKNKTIIGKSVGGTKVVITSDVAK